MHTISNAQSNIGVAQADITPPVGVYNRCWGAAKHDRATGIHRPLKVCIWAIESTPTIVLVGMDGSWWQGNLREQDCRRAIASVAGTTPDKVLLCVSHSHAAVPLLDAVPDVPGGEILHSWLEALPGKLADVTEQALQTSFPSNLQSSYGACNLAACRDQLGENGWIVGHDPSVHADPTLAIARLTFAKGELAGQLRSILVNYACHPTSLAWENSLLSPDYIGALRDNIAKHYQVPLLFLQGAGAELAPAWQYSGDPNVADRNGECLALSVRSAMTTMPLPGQTLVAERTVSSGAELGQWLPRDVELSSDCSVEMTPVDLPWRDDFESSATLAELIECREGAEQERLRRRLRLRQEFGDASYLTLDAWTARLGDIMFFGAPAENYSILQQELRSHFSDNVVLVANHCNGGSGYLPPKSLYDRHGYYPAWQSPMAAGSYEHLKSVFLSQGESLIQSRR